MKRIYGIDTHHGNALRNFGSVSLKDNWLRLHFNPDTLDRVGDSFRPFILLGLPGLTWPAIPADLGKPTAKIWANPVGQRKDQRPLAWVGWRLSANVALLRPAVQCPALAGFELIQDGFLTVLGDRDEQGQTESEVHLRGHGGEAGGGDRLPSVRDGLRDDAQHGNASADQVPEQPAPVVKRRGRSLSTV